MHHYDKNKPHEMSNKMITAVDWLIIAMQLDESHPTVIEAKKIMEAQIRHAYEAGYDSAENYTEISTDAYYNETYNINQ